MNDIDILAHSIADALGKGDDVPFVRRMANTVIEYRATILKQEFDKNGRFSPNNEDSITVPMKAVPTSECLNEEVDCVVFRTEDKIPRPIRKGRSTVPFSFVGSSNQEVSFIFVKPEEVNSIICGTKFIKASSLYAYFNDYIYTFNHDAGRITIRDTFSDPRELLTLKGCENTPCKTNIEIDEDMKRIIKMMIYEEIRQFNKLPENETIHLNEQSS